MKNSFEVLFDYSSQNFEWDAAKNIKNIEKHGVNFEFAINVFLNPILLKNDERNDYGEERFIALGLVDGVAIFVVFTNRSGDTIRIISAWKGGVRAKRIYRAALME